MNKTFVFYPKTKKTNSREKQGKTWLLTALYLCPVSLLGQEQRLQSVIEGLRETKAVERTWLGSEGGNLLICCFFFFNYFFFSGGGVG